MDRIRPGLLDGTDIVGAPIARSELRVSFDMFASCQVAATALRSGGWTRSTVCPLTSAGRAS